MTSENIDELKELFAKLHQHNQTKRNSLNPQHIVQLQGQAEESLGLLNDVIEELRIIDPKLVDALKSAILQIFDGDCESD